MDRISGLNANELLRELQTFKKYKGKTQKEIRELVGGTANLREELRRLDKKEESTRPFFKKITADIEYETLPSVRCLNCNYPISKYAKTFEQLQAEGLSPIEIFERYNIKRLCCRATLAQPQHISTYRPNVIQQMSKLSINPLLQQDKNDYVKVIEGDRATLKQKINLGGGQYQYIDIDDVSELPSREMTFGDRDYTIHYFKK